MPSPIAARTAAWLLAVAGILAGCSSQPFVEGGDARAVVIGYSGDVESTIPLARRHCAQYEREARLADKTIDTAYFDCVRH